jgi:hypothetical protein
MENRQVGAVRKDGRADGHNEGNKRFSRLYESAKNEQ